MIYKITTNNGYCEFCFEFQQVKESLELQCEEYEEQHLKLEDLKLFEVVTIGDYSVRIVDEKQLFEMLCRNEYDILNQFASALSPYTDYDICDTESIIRWISSYAKSGDFYNVYVISKMKVKGNYIEFLLHDNSLLKNEWYPIENEEQLYNLTNFKELSDETKVNILKDMMRMGAEF